MRREKFPEKVPFRLTRMLVNAMEVCGIEGTFRSTCENVMSTLRDNKDSVMAMLEAFVHDPLINWRLLDTKSSKNIKQKKENETENNSSNPFSEQSFSFGEIAETASHVPSRSVRERELRKSFSEGIEDDKPEELNSKAIEVINRVSKKLTGRDFEDEDDNNSENELLQSLNVQEQVNKLILEATSTKNLAIAYIGWCSFWFEIFIF
jgi:serine/threonine-protein kinase mTOR